LCEKCKWVDVWMGKWVDELMGGCE
jgi:hypothetical protein